MIEFRLKKEGVQNIFDTRHEFFSATAKHNLRPISGNIGDWSFGPGIIELDVWEPLGPALVAEGWKVVEED